MSTTRITGNITEIQRGSVHDGPGLRTVVFLKGCNLRCFWCHNPEAIESTVQLRFDPAQCLGCAACFNVCPEEAHRIVNGRHVIDRNRCVSCFSCTEACLAGALTVIGEKIDAEEVLRIVQEDREFYAASGGGVTVSGGEPTCQPEFVRDLLRRCRNAGIHTAVESNLNCSPETLEFLLPQIDLLMADLKHMDPEKHREGTGTGNERILGNLRSLGNIPLILRTSVVPGFNDSPDTIRSIAEVAAALPNLQYYELLSYHPLGCHKADLLDLKRYAHKQDMISVKTSRELADAAASLPITLFVDGREYRECD